VNCETRLCSQLLGPGDNFLQSYGTIFTERAATGSGRLMDTMSTAVVMAVFIQLKLECELEYYRCTVHRY
jgi:hypothetical protein